MPLLAMSHRCLIFHPMTIKNRSFAHDRFPFLEPVSMHEAVAKAVESDKSQYGICTEYVRNLVGSPEAV